MPMYEYICRGCSEPFEKIVWKADTPDSEIKCPKCGKYEAMKKISLFSFGSRSNRGDFVPAPSSGGCSTCSSGSCSTCG